MEYDSKSIATSKATDRSHKMNMMAAEVAKRKQQEREAHPERRLLFRPKVYDYWKDEDIDDEIAEREALIAQIQAKELKLKQKKEDGDLDSDEDEEDLLEAQKAALERLKNRKDREETYRVRMQMEQDKDDMEKARLEEEQMLSELQNPSTYGIIYTDGYYENTYYFGVKDDLVEKMTEEQELWKEKYNKRYPITFTEKFKTFFWPPKLHCKNKIFRTRGKYMDFPEVIADWPKPLDVNFERGGTEIISNKHPIFAKDGDVDEEALTIAIAENEEQVEQVQQKLKYKNMTKKEAAAAATAERYRAKTKFGEGEKDYGWEDWYYDDDEGDFFRKKEGFSVEYYMDTKNGCWRRKRTLKRPPERQLTPYDWYFDTIQNKFIACADYKGLDAFTYDAKMGVYKRKEVVSVQPKPKKPKPPGEGADPNAAPVPSQASTLASQKSSKKVSLKSFFFDEGKGKWRLQSEADAEEEETPEPEGEGEEEETEPKPRIEIKWDENGHRYARKVEGEWRGASGYSPDDYYYDDTLQRYLMKPPKQGKEFKYFEVDGAWRRSGVPVPKGLGIIALTGESPASYFFDDFEGVFKLKENGSTFKYWMQKYSHIWRKYPEPQSGMYPDEFYWDSNKKLWLPRAIRMEMLKSARTAIKKKWTAEISQQSRVNPEPIPSNTLQLSKNSRKVAPSEAPSKSKKPTLSKAKKTDKPN